MENVSKYGINITKIRIVILSFIKNKKDLKVNAKLT